MTWSRPTRSRSAVEIVGRDLAKLIETLKRPPSGHELGEWLEEHAQVADLSASTSVLDELIDRQLVDQDDPAMWKRAGIDGDIRWARYRGEADYELFIAADLSRYGCSCRAASSRASTSSRSP